MKISKLCWYTKLKLTCVPSEPQRRRILVLVDPQKGFWTTKLTVSKSAGMKLKYPVTKAEKVSIFSGYHNEIITVTCEN